MNATAAPHGVEHGMEHGMERLIHAHAWARTSLGPMESWPAMLRSTVRMVLSARTPLAIFWGPELVLVYNDAYGELIGDKHPQALGRPAREVFEEVWDTIGPMCADVLSGKRAAEHQNALLPLDRGNGIEEAWWDYTLNPLPQEDGTAAAVLVVAVEVTARVRAEQELRRLNETLEHRVVERTRRLQTSESHLRDREEELSLLLEQIPVGVGMVDGEGRTLSLNRAGLRLHGFASPQEMLAEFEQYRQLFELRRPDGEILPAEEWPLARALRGEELHDVEVRLSRRDRAHERIVAYSAVPLPTPCGRARRIVFVLHDITERRCAEEELRRALDLIEGITQGTEDMIAAEDEQFRFLFFNEAYRREFEKLWGRRIEVGTSMMDVLAPWPEEQRKARDLWARALGGESFIVTMEFGPSEEEQQVYDLRFNPVKDAQGRVIGAAHIFRNVTERVRTQQALRRSEERLREADQRKDEYLAMLGHELRNPLAAVQSATELVKATKTDDDPHLERACRVLERQSEHMARLIDGLLEVSRIARGKIELDRAPLDLRTILDRVLEDRSTDQLARGVDLEQDFPEQPLWVLADHVRLAQVFDNLVGNALKFTEAPGRVTVTLRGEDGCATVRVRDTGVGIRPQLLAHIFEPFQQEAQDIARTSGGLGLGLALAKGLVELHRGTIEARSDGPDTGAELTVRLPLTLPPADAIRPSRAATVPARRILIVEDNVDAAQMLGDLLALRGHDVTTVANGHEALEALRQDTMDVVLCDLGLPGMSGHDLARTIRDDAALRQIALVALTGYGQPEDRARSAEAGFDEHLVKPVDLRALEETLARVGHARPRGPSRRRSPGGRGSESRIAADGPESTTREACRPARRRPPRSSRRARWRPRPPRRRARGR